LAVAIKLNDMDMIKQPMVNKIKQKMETDWKAKNLKSEGGNYYV